MDKYMISYNEIPSELENYTYKSITVVSVLNGKPVKCIQFNRQ